MVTFLPFRAYSIDNQLIIDSDCIDNILFQFHKGTIKPVYRDASIRSIRVFQFHKGTIKPLFKQRLTRASYVVSIP